MKKQVVAAGIIGEVLEWYDFTLYAFLAPVLATLFFPTHDPILSLLATFGGFAAGYLTRPLGGIIFGHLGDRFGRKNTLAFTLLLMAVPTFLMGLLPTYQNIGIWAPILLILLRLLQGLSCGGEYTGSIIFLYEHSSIKHQGFFSSLAIMGSFIGGLLSITVISITTAILSHESLYAWGWRLPFLFGIVTAIIGFYTRMKVAETPIFEQIKKKGDIVRIPLIHIFKMHKRTLLMIMGVSIQVDAMSYIIIAYMPTYLTKIIGLPMANAMLLTMAAIITVILTLPLFGALTDKIGSKSLLIISAIGIMLAAYPVYNLFLQNQLEYILIGELIFGLFIAMGMAASPKIIASMVPPQLRYSTISIGHGIGIALFGGTAPLIVTFLIDKTGSPFAPTYYIIITAIVTLLSALRLRSGTSDIITSEMTEDPLKLPLKSGFQPVSEQL